MNTATAADEAKAGKPGDNSLTAAAAREPLATIKKKLPLRVLSAEDFSTGRRMGSWW